MMVYALKTLLRNAALFVICLGLSGCLKPLYAPHVKQRILTDLAAINTLSEKGYFAYRLKAELDFQLTNGAPTPERYALTFKTREQTLDSVLLTSTGRNEISSYRLSLSYTLKDVKSGKTLYADVASTRIPFYTSPQEFANMSALRNVKERAAKVIAEDIKENIIFFFLSKYQS